MTNRAMVHEVALQDVGKPFSRIDRRFIGGGWGRVLSVDVGKRIYDVGGVLQIENVAQRDERLGK